MSKKVLGNAILLEPYKRSDTFNCLLDNDHFVSNSLKIVREDDFNETWNETKLRDSVKKIFI